MLFFSDNYQGYQDESRDVCCLLSGIDGAATYPLSSIHVEQCFQTGCSYMLGRIMTVVGVRRYKVNV